MAYGVVRTDNMAGTDVRALMRSVEFQSSNADAAIENGNVVLLGDLKTGEREVYLATAPAASSPLAAVALVASPEVMYDDRKIKLVDFRNEAGDIARAYLLHSGDIFSVTADCLANASPAAGQVVELAASTKWNNVSEATSGSTVVGKIIAVDVVGSLTYYVIKVD